MAKLFHPHVSVNSIADYYDIPELRKQANAKIRWILETAWSADGLSNTVEEVFESTSDKALRQIMATVVADHIEELIRREDFVKFKMMNEFTFSVMQQMKSKRDAAENELRRTKIALQMAEESCTQEKSLKERETMKLDGAIKSIDGCLNTLSRTRTCRHCSAEFCCRIEHCGSSQYPVSSLRCRKCRTSHFPL